MQVLSITIDSRQNSNNPLLNDAKGVDDLEETEKEKL